ncbi:hypothetical protein ALI144C_37565 [Actinosynnema sp. ALI-1.44]|uniref:winged helix-turn-helix transcriptional regulator n=1 Tax=Actinosynnema sp. ALI-1.44 TaxID=1933779 RepID=UPI00097BB24E|nr:helix-turn-helix transcriptional regulator [Actinosynnema sp. ALI-1.44]ONI76360.1 hypothetical protein ALI144C_37565 [Actinosynnema sp. ALI-1.44]
MRPQKPYGQLCPLAAGLDVLGDEVTLLLIRELLVADADFAELCRSVADDAISDGELLPRLDTLVGRGILDEDSGRYHITEFGEGLRVPIQELSWWGSALSLPSSRVHPA